MFSKIPMSTCATISNMLRTWLICLCWSVVWFLGVIRKCFLAWIFFTAYYNGIATKLAEKLGKEPCWSAVLVCLHSSCLIVSDFYIIISWYSIVDLDWPKAIFLYCFIIRGFLENFIQIMEKRLWWSLFRRATLFKSDSNTSVFP